MKRIGTALLACLAATCLLPACQDKLDEQPRSIIVPAFFQTAQGLKSGLDAAYAGTRTIWGPTTFFTLTVPGTDEFISGNDGDNGLVKYNSNYTTSDGSVSAIWKTCYTFINTCNGIIDNAVLVNDLDATTKAQMVAEAKFLRANYYFVLVQLWGDVTLNKTLQTTPSTSATRDKLADVYDSIIQDLKDALPVLPLTPGKTAPGKANAAVANHLLAKVYLTRAYSTAQQPGDALNAYNYANTVITRSGLSLLPDFGRVFAEGNEANGEVLWAVQHTTNLAYNGSPTQNNSGPDNLLCHLWVPKYEVQPGMQRDVFYGRPYIRCVPTNWLLGTAFGERVLDQRYKKTFQTVWLANNAATIPKVNGTPKYAVGDTAIWMPGYEMTAAKIATYRYQVIPPSKYSIALSPAMTKYFDTKRPDPNAPSIRPIIVYRLAETYLIAAEAALKDGRPADALPLINAVRERAAYPSANARAMDVRLSDITLDFILDERSRELCGELTRWLDLVRTGKLVERVRLYNTDGKSNIQPYHVLRPIPQSQIDATITGPAYPQNPGW